jgi:hypothetical protein
LARAAAFETEKLCRGAALTLESPVLCEQPRWPSQNACGARPDAPRGNGIARDVQRLARSPGSGTAPPALVTSYADVDRVIAPLLGIGFAGERVSGAE